MRKSSLPLTSALVALAIIGVFGNPLAVPGNPANGIEDCVRVDARCANWKECNLGIYLASLPNQGLLGRLANGWTATKTVCGNPLLPGNAFVTHINQYQTVTFNVPRGTTLKASAGLLSAMNVNTVSITIQNDITEITCMPEFFPLQCSQSFRG